MTSPIETNNVVERKEAMSNKAIEQLATYFSGSNVAAASIALELGGHARTMAEPYFAMRKALGIEGYADRAKAVQCINASLTQGGKNV